MGSIDIFIQNYISTVREDSLTQFLYLLTILFDYSFHFVLIAFCIAVLIYLVRNIKYSILFIFSLGFGAAIVYILKIIFDVSRPIDGVMHVLGKSFPSGHATVSTIFFVMLIYIFDDYFTSFRRHLFNFACLLMIFLVAISRVYLGVHWVSDVLAGILLGCAVSFVSVYISRFSCFK
ncbi:MAG: phosphatase PAP2 family protein [Minisyncoccia bacterium]